LPASGHRAGLTGCLLPGEPCVPPRPWHRTAPRRKLPPRLPSVRGSPPDLLTRPTCPQSLAGHTIFFTPRCLHHPTAHICKISIMRTRQGSATAWNSQSALRRTGHQGTNIHYGETSFCKQFPGWPCGSEP
ncbi:hypothetical protein LEMLEM_LOCUS11230, partial [Lemmus lemmus]